MLASSESLQGVLSGLLGALLQGLGKGKRTMSPAAGVMKGSAFTSLVQGMDRPER